MEQNNLPGGGELLAPLPLFYQNFFKVLGCRGERLSASPPFYQNFFKVLGRAGQKGGEALCLSPLFYQNFFKSGVSSAKPRHFSSRQNQWGRLENARSIIPLCHKILHTMGYNFVQDSISFRALGSAVGRPKIYSEFFQVFFSKK